VPESRETGGEPCCSLHEGSPYRMLEGEVMDILAQLEEFVETVARRIAAEKCGLVKDPYGERLPDDIWTQAIPEARRLLLIEAE